jgi:SPP1 family predicted phage head-tail adaptor
VIRAGALNRRVTILQQSTARDEAGGLSSTWTPVLTTWGSIRTQTATQIFESAEYVSKVTYLITVRYRTDIVLDNSKRVQYTELTTGVTHTYEIKAPLNTLAGNRELVLVCYELDGKE